MAKDLSACGPSQDGRVPPGWQGEEVAFSLPLADNSENEVKSLSRVQLFVTPWPLAYQAPPSTGFSRKEYWSRLPFPSPRLIISLTQRKEPTY